MNDTDPPQIITHNSHTPSLECPSTPGNRHSYYLLEPAFYYPIPMTILPSAIRDKLGFSAVIATGTLVAYYFWIGRSNLNRRRKLEQQLKQVDVLLHM